MSPGETSRSKWIPRCDPQETSGGIGVVLAGATPASRGRLLDPETRARSKVLGGLLALEGGCPKSPPQRGPQPRHKGFLPRNVSGVPLGQAGDGEANRRKVEKRWGWGSAAGAQGHQPGSEGHRESDVVDTVLGGMALAAEEKGQGAAPHAGRGRGGGGTGSTSGAGSARHGSVLGTRGGKDLQLAVSLRLAAARHSSGLQGGAQTSLSSSWAPLPARRAGARVADR